VTRHTTKYLVAVRKSFRIYTNILGRSLKISRKKKKTTKLKLFFKKDNQIVISVKTISRWA